MCPTSIPSRLDHKGAPSTNRMNILLGHVQTPESLLNRLFPWKPTRSTVPASLDDYGTGIAVFKLPESWLTILLWGRLPSQFAVSPQYRCHLRPTFCWRMRSTEPCRCFWTSEWRSLARQEVIAFRSVNSPTGPTANSFETNLRPITRAGTVFNTSGYIRVITRLETPTNSW